MLPDRVVFAQGGILRSRRLDLAGRTLTGDPITLAEPVGVDSNGRGGFAVSEGGVVAYRGADGAQQYTWFDRTGKAVGSADEPGRLYGVNLSPDDQRVAGAPLVQGNRDIWLWDSRSATRTRLTFDAATDAQPIWSPDGRRIAFTSNRTGAYNLHVRPSDGSGTDARFGPPVNDKAPTDWSMDGRWVLYYEVHPTTGLDVWALDMEATDRPPRAVAVTPADELQASFSPDGRWLAYQTNASGRYEVIVQPFDDVGGKWQVSTAGGVSPRWRADGRELYFLAPDATMMAAAVTTAGTSLTAGTPVALFPTRILEGGASRTVKQYAVSRDGRFLINQMVADAAAPITLILNWNPDAKR